nr:metal-dependent transcriptional regulator [uncultured Sellimonas sp.]
MGYISHRSEESVEDYLETIYVLSQRLPVVRSVDIATEMHFSKPSISVAMKNLRSKDLVTVSPEGYISLTEEGLVIAKKTYERHTLFTNWLIELGVSPDIAAQDACKMEHDISTESFNAIKKFISH